MTEIRTRVAQKRVVSQALRAGSRAFWKRRARRDGALLRIRSWIFQARHQSQEQLESGTVMVGLGRAVWRWVLAAVALVFVIEYLAELASQAWGRGPSWLPLWDDAGGELLQPQLLVIAQIGAVLLGLFFAAVGVVASTVYADAPQSARSLFVWERANRVYARFLSILVAATLSLLVAQVLGHQPSRLIVVMLSAYAVVAVLALVVVAPRTFAFFDPLETTEPLFNAIGKWQRLAASGGYMWREAAFQDHYRKQASATLGQLHGVIGYAARTKRSHPERFGQLGRELLSAWRSYSTVKASIPLESHWYERKYAHPNWSLAEYHRTGVALATKTPLTPDREPDHLWAERRMSTMIGTTLTELLGRGDDRTAVAVVLLAGGLARELYARLQYNEFRLLWKAVTGSLWERLGQLDAGSKLTDEEAALVDAWASMPIEAAIGLKSFATRQSPSRFSRTIKRAMEKPNGIYEGAGLGPILPRLERTISDRELEIVAEGHVVSPVWFTTQLAARSMVNELDRATGVVIQSIEEDVCGRAISLAVETPHCSATIVSRGIEACHKLDAHLPSVADQIEALAALQRTPDDQWLDTPYSRWLEASADLYQRFLKAAVTTLHQPDALPAGPELPDQFGQLRSVIADEIFESMLRGDASAFSDYFPTYIGTIDAAQRRSLLAVPKDNPRAQMLAAIQPWLDAFELSGYAMFFSRLDNPAFWSICNTTWEALFGALSDTTAKLEGVTAGLLYRESLFGLAPGDVQRSSRKQRFVAALHERGLSRDEFDDHLAWDEDPAIDNEVDPVVATFLDSPSFHELGDLFLSEHLYRLPEAAGLSMPRGVEQLREALTLRSRRTGGEPHEVQDDSEE